MTQPAANQEMDWATDLALTIVAETIGRGPYSAVVGLVAARLRLLREQGVAEGIEQARQAVLG